jgi:hypothetical protein
MRRDTTIPESHKLKGETNYGTWSFLMENILRNEDLWNYCITPPPAATVITPEESKERCSTHTILNLSCHLDLL